jgi:hypothetical protein
MPAGIGAEETDDPVYADKRNFYKVEQWDAHDHILAMLFAGTSLDRARETFDEAVKRRPAGRFTVRQRSRVLAQYPE